jgi:hypothetical protein
MLRRGVVRLQNNKWHGLQEFVVKDADGVAFRAARAADTVVRESVEKASAPTPTINWKEYQDNILHKDLVATLKEYQSNTQLCLSGR